MKQIKGEDVFKLSSGNLLRLVGKGEFSTDKLEQIVLVTSNSNHPLINVKTGDIWGNELENYTFELVKGELFLVESL